MSAGHPHRRPHTRTLDELDRVLATGNTGAMMRRAAALIITYDVPATGGYSVDGVERYIDRTFIGLLRTGQIGVEGMSADQIVHAIMLHEQTEKAVLDGDNGIDDYATAHEFGTVNEHRFVAQFTRLRTYEDGIKLAILKVQHKVVEAPPPKLACAPYFEDDDKNDRRVLAEMRARGVADAFKAPKHAVKYGEGEAAEHCSICAHIQPIGPGLPFAACAKVEGTVQPQKWCTKFQKPAQHAAVSKEAA